MKPLSTSMLSVCGVCVKVFQTAKLRYITSVQSGVFLDNYGKNKQVSPSPANANKISYSHLEDFCLCFTGN